MVGANVETGAAEKRDDSHSRDAVADFVTVLFFQVLRRVRAPASADTSIDPTRNIDSGQCPESQPDKNGEMTVFLRISRQHTPDNLDI